MSYLDNNGLTHFFDNLKNIFVPKSRKINNKTLDEDVTLSPSDIGAASSSDMTSVTSRVTTLENTANKHLDLTKTTTQTMSGALFIGSATSNVGNAFTHQRKPESGYISGKQVYGAAFAVDTSGRSTFQSKSYNNQGTGGVNDAVLRFSKDGIQFAKNSTTANVPAETDYKELATQEWVTSQIEDSKDGGEAVSDVKVNGTSIVSDGVANVSVPTKFSDLTNDSLKLNYNNGLVVSNNFIMGYTKTFSEYESSHNGLVISKGTLDAVLDSRLGVIENGSY